jgi:putative transposase
MARRARFVLVGCPHAIMQTGCYGRPVFEAEADYTTYVGLLEECVQRYRVDVWAYCLMPNQVHFVCVPKDLNSLARAFNTLHMRYTQYFNGKRALRGHLWRGRFMSCALDEQCALEEIRFVETNPSRSGLVSLPEDYPWSSARRHISGDGPKVLSVPRALIESIGDWRAFLENRGQDALLHRIRECLKTGRPAGNAAFIDEMEAVLGSRLTALPRGRPRKTPGKDHLRESLS